MLDLLKERRELDNTYVVFTTDNGTHYKRLSESPGSFVHVAMARLQTVSRI